MIPPPTTTNVFIISDYDSRRIPSPQKGATESTFWILKISSSASTKRSDGYPLVYLLCFRCLHLQCGPVVVPESFVQVLRTLLCCSLRTSSSALQLLCHFSHRYLQLLLQTSNGLPNVAQKRANTMDGHGCHPTDFWYWLHFPSQSPVHVCCNHGPGYYDTSVDTDD